jgi:hypothetical protein
MQRNIFSEVHFKLHVKEYKFSKLQNPAYVICRR